MKSKIGYKLVIAIILFSSLITLITTALQLYMDYRFDMKRVNNYEIMISKSYLESVATSVWMFDEKQIKTQLHGILHLPDMEHLEIQSDEGSVWSVGSVKSKYNLIKEFPLLYKHKGEDVSIGVLHMVVDLDNIYVRLFKKALTILVSNAIKTFLVSGFTLLILQYLLTRHLYSLSNWLRDLDIGKSFEKFQLARTYGKSQKTDELDEVVSAINKMQDNLKTFLADLLKSEKKYKILTENIPMKVFHKDTKSVYVACNKNFAIDFKIQADQIAGKTDFDFFPKELADKYRSDDKRIMKSKKIESFEEKYITPGKQEVIVRTIKTPIWDEEDKVIGLIGSFIDVTELKMTKNALKKSEEKFRRLIENLQETHFLYSHDTLGHFTYVSPSVTTILGYSEKEFLTHYTQYLTDNLINKKAARHTEMSIQGVKQPLYEIEILHKNGSIHKLQVNETPLFDKNGNVISVEGLAHDVTDSKKIESQLQQSQKMETIGTLAGGIAHDFNNILFPIVGYTEMLLEDIPEGSPLRDNLDEIFTGALRARDLVKQILTFSRQDSNEFKLLRLQPVVKEALKLIRSTIPTTINIKQDIRNDCGVIQADPTQIHQIVMNLATNAYHAMENNGGELRVNLKEIALGEQDVIGLDIEPGSYACLTVADTGAGMDKYILDKVFDPFFTTKEPGKGTGMGLSVIHGIVKNTGGSINVYSEIGKGTQFNIYLPVVKSSSEKHELQTKELIQGGTEQILLVDDEKPILKMEKQILERLGYQVVSCDSSLDAIKAFRATPHKFDVVITDMAMPNMSGDKMASELIKLRPDIPILLCTGFSEKMPEEKAESMGIKGFLMKPIIKADLSKKIRKVLDD